METEGLTAAKEARRAGLRRRSMRVRWALVLVLAGCVSGRPVPPAAPPASTLEGDEREWRYAVVIDAGSSGSRALIYQWLPGGAGALPRIEVAPYPRAAGAPAWEARVDVGMASLADDPAAAAESVEPLVRYALERIGPRPEARAGSSLLVRATAGVRLLEPERRAAVMRAVDEYLDELPFGLTSARVISGTEEGVYGWLAANYLLGHLHQGSPFATTGALDLGGASAQITFVPLDLPASHGQVLELGSARYHLYTRSYLGLGQDEARVAVASPACFLVGYPLSFGGHGRGDFAACREAIRETLRRPCEAGVASCSLFGAYQPPVYGEFLAFSVFAYAAEFFGLEERLSPSIVAAAGTEFCARSWPQMVAESPELENDPYVPNYCFTAAYIATLLDDVFGFPTDTDRIRAPRRVQGAEVGWTLGALVYELAGRAD